MTRTMIAPDDPTWGQQPSAEELDQRIQRLEDVIASLCDTQGMEERVRLRILEQLRAQGVSRPGEPPPASSPPPTGTEGDAHSVAGETAAPGPTGFWYWFKTMFVADQPRPASDTASAARPREPVLIAEMLSDIRTLFRLIRDPMYTMSWTAKIVPVCALIYVLWPFDLIWEPAVSSGIPVVGFLDDLVVAWIGFKVLGREIRRYRSSHAGRTW